MRRRVVAVLAALPLLTTISAAGADAATVPLPTPGQAKGVAVQSDGKILTAVQTTHGDRFTVVRTLPDGTLDSTFGGGDGIADTVIEPTMKSIVNDVAVQPDGRILAAGHVYKDINDSKFVVVRFRPDGSLDPSFGHHGETGTDFVVGNGVNPRVALTASGAIVAAGSESRSFGILVARYRADGSPDPTFGFGGKSVFDLPDVEETVNDVAIDAGGNIIVGGRFHTPSQDQHFLARITPAGPLDPTFGSGGVALWTPAVGEGAIRAIAIQPDGRIVTSGFASYGSLQTLSRYLPSGQPDLTFGTGGHVITDFSSFFIGAEPPGADVVVLRDGRLAVTTTISYPAPHVRVSAHTSTGAPDPGFDGDDGVLEVPLGAPARSDRGGFMALTRQGSIVVAGTDVTGNDVGTLEIVAVPSLVPAADVAVSVSATPNPAPAGPVELTVRVRNYGPVSATGAGLTFELSQSIDEVRPGQASCAAVQIHVQTCALGTIPAGREVVVAFTTHVNGFEEGLFGTATVASTTYDPDPTDDSVTAEVLIEHGTTS